MKQTLWQKSERGINQIIKLKYVWKYWNIQKKNKKTITIYLSAGYILRTNQIESW